MVKEKFHHGEVREITLDLFPVHHGGVPTPPWCFFYVTVVFLLTSPRWKKSFTMVKFLSTFYKVTFWAPRGDFPPRLLKREST